MKVNSMQSKLLHTPSDETPENLTATNTVTLNLALICTVIQNK